MKRLFNRVNKWNKIPLDRYLAYEKVCKENYKGVEAIYKKIAALYGFDELQIKKIPIRDLMEYAKIFSHPLPKRLMLSLDIKAKGIER